MKNVLDRFLIVLCLLMIVCLFFYERNTQNKVGWIAISNVYERFDYKIALEKKIIQTQEKRKYILDSLGFQLKALSQNGKIDPLKNVELQKELKNFYAKKELFEQDNEAMKAKYQEQIFVQINQYVSDFAKQNNYDLILSADGSGALMSASDKLNITEDVVKYINLKYAGHE